MKKLLFNRDSACIQPLRELIEMQKHRTLAMWAVDCAEPVLKIFEDRYPQEKRPREAIEAAKAWMRGGIKMPVAKAAIHAAHNAATEVERDAAACAAARAMGHAAATVHVETHALGLVFYGLTAVVYSTDQLTADKAVSEELKRYYDALLFWQNNIDKADITWAPFLLRDGVPNKERLLRQRKEQKREADSANT
jgi:hypothetical protein